MKNTHDIVLTREDLIHILERSDVGNIELQVEIEDEPEKTFIDFRPHLAGRYSIQKIVTRPATREINAQIKFRVKTLDLSTTKLNLILQAE